MSGDQPAILVADPSPENREAVCEILVGLDARIIEAESGAEVPDLARSNAVALVIIDIDMPERDGYQVVNLLRSDEQLGEVPVVFLLPSFAAQRGAMHGHGSNAAETLVKPVNPNLLLDVVRRCLALDPVREQLATLHLGDERILDSDQGVLGLDADGCLRYANPAALRMLRMRLRDADGLCLESIMERETGAVEPAWDQHPVHRTCAAGKTLHVKTANFCTLDGVSLPVTYVAVPAPPGSGLFAALAFQFIGADPDDEVGQAELTRVDPLTGLPGRKRFELAVENAIARASGEELSLAVLFIDLDHFKYVNDTLGHDIGDTLLQLVAGRLEELLGEGDALARLGGDEFTVLLPDLTGTHYAAIMASRMIRAVETPFLVDGHEIYTGCSVGIATYPHCGDNSRVLIQNAAAALHRAKLAGRHQFEFYTAEMNRQNVERMRIETGLHHALDRGEFVLRYLPMVDIRSERVVGLEALIRWEHPEHGTILPEEFMQVAEDIGVIASINTWVLERACRDLAEWSLGGDADDLLVAVNIAASHLLRPDFLHDVRCVLRDTGIPATNLQLDLTERALASSLPECIEVLREIAAAGVRIALDDLGASYSSLRYFRHLDLDALKIDRSFIADFDPAGRDAVIVRSVIAMARSLGIRVIAEGVENEAQLDFLRRKRCDWVQGFYFASPLTAAEVVEMLSSGRELTGGPVDSGGES